MIRSIALLALFFGTVSVRAETAALASAATGCTRASLQLVVDKYLGALRNGNPSLMPLNPQAKYMENRNEVPLGQGIWRTALAIDFNHSWLDADTCQTFTEIAHTSSDHPYLIGTRLKVENNKISEIESLVADKDDWVFNAADYMKYASQEKWDILPPEKRSDRQTLLDVANAYYDIFGDYSAFDKVPWGIPCERVEGGGIHTSSCTVGVPKGGGVKIINRHFLVDLDMGTVVGMVDFREEKRNPDFHAFRLENGKLRYVHTIQVCTVPNCGIPAMKSKSPQ